MATLNVKDALSYLDQVKVQFAEQPDVYNRFLDIMKDFKSQSIDTPGVIERVSTLFRGHPSLIQGFNTFLPPGYRIECSLDENNLITVTTPAGTTTQTPGGVGIAGAINRVNAGVGGSTGAQASSTTAASASAAVGSSPSAPAARNANADGPFTPGGHSMQHSVSAGGFSATSNSALSALAGSNAPATPGATAGAGVLSHAGGVLAGAADPRRPPVEFNHAINYVNKIKQRFSNDPETYKQFLEILQTYQKEQRPIQDVYAEVTVLFDKARDLLEEFKQFLPDTSASSQPQPGLFGAIGQVTAATAQPGVPAAAVLGRDGLPLEGGAAPRKSGAGATKSKKRAAAADAAAAAAGGAAGGKAGQVAGAAKAKKSKHSHKAVAEAQVRSSPPPGAEQPVGLPVHGHIQAFVGPDGTIIHADPAVAAGYMQAVGPNAAMPLAPGQVALASLDEVAFFDRIKRHIDDRGTYLEFLKLLNLFTQDIIDVRTLIDRAALFIGNHRELFSTLKSLCGYDMGKHGWLENEDPIIENVPALQRERTDLNTCKQYGASYRKLPKSEMNLACSGRDPMCWEVLNDVWVSHPTWASEGESFNPHKKNIYEDALYRSEEERHEYDYHIEANLRTIALLEPIAARISTMDNEERASFRLKPGLGGQSKSIYQRVIKKVYGRDHGLEVIAALHDNPCVAVPVVLARLKQKDEEWKRAQREWNKVWREVDARNYYKSLDHQGINFKTTDKKTITSKALIAEIETRRTQQQQRRLNIDPTLPRARPRYQLAYVIDDLQVITDVLKLSFSMLDRANYSKADSDKIEQFLRTFLPNLLALHGKEFEELLTGDEDDDEDDAASVGTASAIDDDAESNASVTSSSGSRRGHGSAKHQADLRRKLLKSQAESSGAAKELPTIDENAAEGSSEKEGGAQENGDTEMADGTASATAGETADGAVGETVDSAAVGENHSTWIQTDLSQTFDSRNGQNGADAHEQAETAAAAARKQNFFCNTTFYVFVRLFQILYSRLHKMKTLAQQKAAVYPHKSRVNPVAVQLGLQDGSTGPSAVVGTVAAAAGANNAEEAGLYLHPSRYYDTVLDLCEKLFDSELDQATFEESVRYMYGIDGYVIFTVDKVVSAFIKAAQSLTSDQRCQELLGVFDRDRARPHDETLTYKHQIENRMAAEAIIGKDENLFRLEWIPQSSTMLMQMLSKDDLTLDDPATAEQKWLYYVSTYCLWQPTEGLPGEAQAPFLKRSIPPNAEAELDVQFTVVTGLEIKICIRTYRLFFVSGTEDVFARHRSTEELKAFDEKSKVLKKKKADKFKAWLESKRSASSSSASASTATAAAAGPAKSSSSPSATTAAAAPAPSSAADAPASAAPSAA